MKKSKLNTSLLAILIVLMILFIPMIIFSTNYGIPALVMEIFLSVLHSLFIIGPLCKRFAKEPNEMHETVLLIRMMVIVILSLFNPDLLIEIDSFILTYGIFISIIISITVKPKTTTMPPTVQAVQSVILSQKVTCSNCNSIQPSTNKFCTNCGNDLTGSQVMGKEKILTPLDFDPIYMKDEEKLLEEIIEKELQNANFDKNTSYLPATILKKKFIMSTIFSILLFVFISIIFFHFPIYTYAIGIIILVILHFSTKKYDFMTYLKKEIKSRPSEKISNIIMNIKESLAVDNTKKLRIYCAIVATILPLIIFVNPRIMYEKSNDGYAVRFYTFGLTNFTTAEIPENHNDKPVISLRGNTFSNMPFLKEVKLPDSVKEIRGQAFKNDISLEKVNIPQNLEYLGGGAFYNCASITKIELPDTLTFLGGESFYNASSLKEVKLSENLTEIRGDSFENCDLESVTIPDKVERIGGHAFYGNSSLKEVIITENSELKEIGSSAFRLCTSLNEIKLPKATSVNSKAFKESPTIIKRFGDIDYDTLVDASKYNHQALLYLYTGSNETINRYNTTATIYNTQITLVDAKYVIDSYQFVLKYTDETGEKEFTLDKYKPYEVINENIAFRISNESAITNYTRGLSIKVYYN